MKSLLDTIVPELLDAQARDLALQLEWWPLPGLGLDQPSLWLLSGRGLRCCCCMDLTAVFWNSGA